ncbi:MAG: tetratricopeptide repeat protein [Bacteroidota bacterium]|nr:tetratricopeptide repeat protein [Bacteroidota bacterium]
MKHVICMIAGLLMFLLVVEADDTRGEKLLYDRALTEYQNNNFEESLELFQKLIASGYSSYKLYYNTGNAAFKTGDIPEAILNYEKALLIKPFNEDARYNLEIAKTYTVDKLEAIPEVFFIRWFKLFSLLLHTNTWSIISMACFAFSLILLAVFLFSARYKLKKQTFLLAVVLFVISLLSFALALTNKSLILNNNEAIVFEPVVTGTSSPGTGGNELFVIHEGTKVEVEDKLGEWYEIRLSDGTVGWIPMDFVRKIIP